MNLLVIGSDSFIAKNFILTNKDKFNITSISRIKTSNNSELVIPDLYDIPIELFIGKNVVLNFAAIVHRSDSIDPNLYNEINYNLVVINAKKARDAKVGLFIQLSTIAVYGNVSNISVENSYNPENIYAISKLKADLELIKMQNENFKVALIRPPMVYGGGNAPGNMMRLIKIVNNSIILPFKDIDNQRDFINVSNLIQYLTIVIEQKLIGIYLITDQEPISTSKIINTIIKFSNKKTILISLPKIFRIILKKINFNCYSKIFQSLSIKTNFPFESLIHKQTVESGIKEMVTYYIKSKKLK